MDSFEGQDKEFGLYAGMQMQPMERCDECLHMIRVTRERDY